MTFAPVDPKTSIPQLEERILAYWSAHQIVAKNLASGERPFVFYEGPPTANGRPGLHHAISRIFKDVICRYRSMQGYRIIGRREGWDTHGLPVEIEVEKRLGFSGKPDIERYGIAAFNAQCRESVWNYIQDWRAFTRRIAYWVSEDAYITYDNHYIESLWWILRRLFDDGMLFRDYKVTMHCPRCGTSLSDHEVNLGFQDDVDDPSVWLRFRVRDVAADSPLAGVALLAWTTTPWTLPANVALAVKPEATYVVARHDGERVLLAEALLESVCGSDAVVEARIRGADLVGVRYEHLYDGAAAPGDEVDSERLYRVIADEYVSLDDGTGIVHIAPAYGDLEIGRRHGLPTLFSVDLSGLVLTELGDLPFVGKFFKAADPDITRDLRDRGLLFRSGRVRHAYPFCWRCGTPLLYYAKRSWYIRTTARKDLLVQNNQQIRWVPEHIRDGRFGNWLENNIDWAISRERYWGTPLPIWVAEDGYTECIGSLAELEQRVGRSLAELDLHRPYVDEITWDDPVHGTMRRIPDVADCWFDSGAMPVAQWHYPMENQALYEASQQADYICEAVDQTRGWFYTLHALSTMLFGRPAFHNVICLGHILDGEGQKMSKSKGNVVDPWQVIGEQGSDALRWYLFTASPPGSPRRFSGALVNETLRKYILTLWNTYAFFVTYATLDGWQPTEPAPAELTPIDRWALARLNALVRDVTAAFEAYDVTSGAREIEVFVDELSNWYVRRNRRRFWRSEADADKQAAYATLYTCLVTVVKLAAPYIPFISEEIYQNLVRTHRPDAAESVHLARWPTVDAGALDERLVADTSVLLRAVSLGRAARKSAGLKVRQPLQRLWVRAATAADTDGLRRFAAELRDELNVKEIGYLDSSSAFVEYRFRPNLRLVGRKHGKQVPAITAALRALTGDAARAVAAAVERGAAIDLPLADGTVSLLAEEVLLESSSPEGFVVAEDGGVLCALDTTITDALRYEGAARELVRNVQDARKAAGYAISDRITILVGGSDPLLDAALAHWAEYVRDETLADAIVVGDAPPAAHQFAIELDGGPIPLAIVRR